MCEPVYYLKDNRAQGKGGRGDEGARSGEEGGGRNGEWGMRNEEKDDERDKR